MMCSGRPCRIAMAGFCFLVFGLMGLAVLCLIFPTVCLLYKGGIKRQTCMRTVVHHSLSMFSRIMVACGCISFEVRGKEKLNREGLFIIANHPSLIDVVLLMGLVRQPNCVVKASLKTNLFTRGPVGSAGFIVNSDGPGLIDDCIASVRSGDHLIIFPEGTRSLDHLGTLSTMKRGAANIALRGGINLTPVVITVSEPLLGKGQSWRQAPLRRPHYVLTVMDDIAISTYLEAMTPDSAGAFNRMARTLTQHLDTFFTREIKQAQNAGVLPIAQGSCTGI